jgi:thioredoxin-related protein
MISKIYILLILFCLPIFGAAQSYSRSIDKIDSLLAVNQKPILLFFTADWCKYCKAMESEVFSDDLIFSIVENEFYFFHVKDDLKNKISFNGDQYQFIPTGIEKGYHEFAEEFATIENNISYPTLTILWNEEELVRISNYLNKEELIVLLNKVLDKTNALQKGAR